MREDAIPALKKWFLREGHALHLRAREEIAKYDLDVNPDAKYKGSLVHVRMGSYSFISKKGGSHGKR